MKIEKLPDSELSVMLVLWSVNEPMKTSAILELLSGDKSWTMSTLQTILSRLQKRGFVEVTTEKRLNYYSPKISAGAIMTDENTVISRTFENTSERRASLQNDTIHGNIISVKTVSPISIPPSRSR